jgi:GTP-binding protein HflX
MRRPWPLVCLVGYTNVGKSTLLNAFTPAKAYVDDRLFATLDTKTRLVHLPDGKDVLLTDTVGFIRHLPHGLVASFRSTLEVATDADFLLVVADAAHPRLTDHQKVVVETLKEISADKVPSLLILNKADLPEARARLERLKQEHPDAVVISARRKQGLDRVKAVVAERLKNVIHSRNSHREP